VVAAARNTSATRHHDELAGPLRLELPALDQLRQAAERILHQRQLPQLPQLPPT
jgi:hypothetical protein